MQNLTLLALLLALFLPAAQAQSKWLEVAKYKSPDGILYIQSKLLDLATIYSNRHVVEEMFDSKNIDDEYFRAFGFRSFTVTHEYDCKENKFRRLSLAFYSGQMGAGNITESQSETGNWVRITQKKADFDFCKVLREVRVLSVEKERLEQLSVKEAEKKSKEKATGDAVFCAAYKAVLFSCASAANVEYCVEIRMGVNLKNMLEMDEKIMRCSR